MASKSPRSLQWFFFTFLTFFQLALAQGGNWFTTTNNDGDVIYLNDNRRPSLYTGNFGDCLGNSLVNVTRFDAAYYKDNMTILFHLAGDTGLRNESLMMYIGVFAYGEDRFDLTFNPCSANIKSMCPMRAGIPIEANGIIPVSVSDVANIPEIALSIPDFEGQAILRIFANSTQQEIGCFSAVITNGASFSHPAAIGSVLGIFAFVAVVASFATAMYGDQIPAMRNHYAHSMSVLVVFAVYQHIFFTGALSMNWPSVLVAWWSNFAWAGGMIYSPSMQNSISKFVGTHIGNTSAVGAAGAGMNNEDLGGGYDLSRIYKRTADVVAFESGSLDAGLMKRALANASEGYRWYGDPVGAGLPLPGNYSGFAGTLGEIDIPASNAFMTGFLWLLILLVGTAALIAAFKWGLEGLIRMKRVNQDRLEFFRSHWMQYIAQALLRICFIAFFMMMFLTIFQFTYDGSPGMIAIAAIVFLIFFIGMLGIAGYACYYRLRFGNWISEPDRIHLERTTMWKVVPWYRFSRGSSREETEKPASASIPFWRVSHTKADSQAPVHEDIEYTMKFGWLVSRFRTSRWWFFAGWLGYEFIRACFYGGASGHPMTQVFGLLVVEFIAFAALIAIRPFEGQRLNALLVYLLGLSKVATVALSAAFDNAFNLARIPTTAIGIVIIVIQGILTIVLLIAIVIGAISSYMSLTRNREGFKPRRWAPMREKYFAHVEQAATDQPRLRPEPEEDLKERESPKEPYFSVNSVRRVPKVEDEDQEFMNEIRGSGDFQTSDELLASHSSLHHVNDGATNTTPGVDGIYGPGGSMPSRRNSRISTHSNRSASNVPYGAKVHRASWSTADFSNLDDRPRSKRDSDWDRGSRRGSGMVYERAPRSSQEGVYRLSTPSGSYIPTSFTPLNEKKTAVADEEAVETTPVDEPTEDSATNHIITPVRRAASGHGGAMTPPRRAGSGRGPRPASSHSRQISRNASISEPSSPTVAHTTVEEED
ncbi:TRP-domain-containing protein [Aulographum hederae CBS 113979]|uniref:TRP-domain-containing protein n=1 Tax=Aulographum hederae CBS 113979 TaxID=1176131 RepID=A0A6G1HF15_9PEZI|nr:TRP-domain-containing protein [Aulographum hederae CBS 113979]